MNQQDRRRAIALIAVLGLCALGLGGCATWTSSQALLSKIGLERKPVEQNTFERAMLRGTNLERSGQLDQARKFYEELGQEYPNRYEVVHRLGVLADQQRRHREAEGFLSQAAQLAPGNAEILNDLGYCLYLQGKIDAAEGSLRQALSIDPAPARFHNNLGLVLGFQGRYQESLAEFRLAGSEADAQYNLAFVFAVQDRLDEAQDCFQRALTADPTHEKSRRALESFRQSRRPDERFFDQSGTMPYLSAQHGSSQTLVSSAELPSARMAGVATRALRSDSAAVGGPQPPSQ